MDIKFNIIKKLVQLKKKFGTQSQATDIMEVDDWLIKNTSEIIKLEF